MYDCTSKSSPSPFTRSPSSSLPSSDFPYRSPLAISDLLSESYLTLSQLCPNLITLHLEYCGRIETPVMAAWGKQFKKLKRMELGSPFLVREDGWKGFFVGVGKRLEGFLIT